MEPRVIPRDSYSQSEVLAEVSIFINTTESADFLKSLFALMRKSILDSHLDPAVVKLETTTEALKTGTKRTSRYYLKILRPDSSETGT